VLRPVAKGKNKLRESHGEVDTGLCAFINVLITCGGSDPLEPKAAGKVECFKSSEDITFLQAGIEEWSGKTLRDINAGFIRPLIPVGRACINVGDKLTPCRIVVDIDKLEGVEVGELALCTESAGAAIQVTLSQKDPLAEQTEIIFVFVIAVPDVADPSRCPGLVGVAGTCRGVGN